MRDQQSRIDLARQLVSFLPGWRVVVGEWSVDLVREDGATIGLDDRTDKRIIFTGIPPRFADGERYYGNGEERPSITCASSRAPEAMAREIRRRLIPTYDHAYAVARAYVDRHDARRVQAEQAAERLAFVTGGEVLEKTRRWRRDDVPIGSTHRRASRA